MTNHRETIKGNINSYFPVSPSSADLLINLVEVDSIAKETTFIKRNTRNDYDYFLLSGICRSYILNQEGEEVSISFFQDQTVLTPNVARTFNDRSTLNFEALTELDIARFKAIELVELMKGAYLPLYQFGQWSNAPRFFPFRHWRSPHVTALFFHLVAKC